MTSELWPKPLWPSDLLQIASTIYTTVLSFNLSSNFSLEAQDNQWQRLAV